MKDKDMRIWCKVLDALRSDARMEEVVRLAEKAAHKDRRCTRVTLLGDYAENDYSPEKARVLATGYLELVLVDGGMDACRWTRLSQMLATARIYEEA